MLTISPTALTLFLDGKSFCLRLLAAQQERAVWQRREQSDALLRAKLWLQADGKDMCGAGERLERREQNLVCCYWIAVLLVC